MRLAKLGTRDVYVPGATHTRRQRLLQMLREGWWSSEALREELGGTRRELEEDLEHLDRTLRRRGSRLVIHAAHCYACGFRFRSHSPRRFRAPTRCPICHSERVIPPSFGAR